MYYISKSNSLSETKQIEILRKRYPIGTRIKLVHMDDIQAPPTGTLGTVRYVDDIGTIHIKWDNGSSLGLVVGEDNFVVIQKPVNV